MTDVAPIHDAAELTRYIETRYHARHREQLPPLAEMAEKVENVHFGDDDVPEGLSAVLRRMIGEMEVHMKKEELILFPAIRKGGGPGIENPIAVMRSDHDDHAAEVAEIRRLTEGLTLPQGACGTWTALYVRLDAFITDLEEHMRLENEVLFPQFEQRRGQPMALASVTLAERGATDRLLDAVVARLIDDGIRVAGALRPIGQGGGNGHCASDLRLLPDGPVVRITQDLGAGSTACRMDAGALEEAVGLATARLAAEGADLVVLNKFGLSEAEGRGFRALIAEALGHGVPVLIGLSETHRAAFERFSEGMASALPPDEATILDWCRAMVRTNADLTEEA